MKDVMETGFTRTQMWEGVLRLGMHSDSVVSRAQRESFFAFVQQRRAAHEPMETGPPAAVSFGPSGVVEQRSGRVFQSSA